MSDVSTPNLGEKEMSAYLVFVDISRDTYVSQWDVRREADASSRMRRIDIIELKEFELPVESKSEPICFGAGLEIDADQSRGFLSGYCCFVSVIQRCSEF